MTEIVHSIAPREAWRLLEENPKAILIDVRAEMEYLWIGHPKGAIHIPWIDEPDWTVNPHFAAEVRKLLLGGVITDHDDVEHPIDSIPILLICRSGNRSLEAGKELVRKGFSNVYNVIEGFEGPLDHEHHRSTISGWRFHGLPWEQI
ncbi:rhodanese-like domain-containing protein [Beggiatoa leptomitoformis]|uniref:Rhodanese-like domain-containing protein n=1 Tax=Beggiatoa leptomitoformis TaxID=288004 RepID=A0A2N9YAW4_9GAMM|nr:rhodanese-like domain-containing protein [Beggiatoa leptomitoformis]ALG67032.1 rhodanese-like domain-containing protein [Beggiatoa leptomitoformis]AUI67590.1 rhodanese-like domain-containing protein [Beggiatoa leptomitoformis]